MEAASGIAMLTARLGRDTDLVARLAAPLWARVGRTIRVEDLSWTRNLAGEEGPGIVWRALEEVGGLLSGQSRLTAEGVAQLCTALISTPVSPSDSSDPERGLPQVVWTLPLAHNRHTSRGASYREAFVDLIDRSQKRLILVAPFVDSAGIGGLMIALLTAMLRRVEVTLLTNDALNIASFTSQAIEELRREAERVSGDLSVYTAEAGSSRDRLNPGLAHAEMEGSLVEFGSRSVFANSVGIRSIFSTCNALGQDGLQTLPDVPPSVCYPSGRHRQRRRPKPGGQRNLDPRIGRERASRHGDCQHHGGRGPAVRDRSTQVKC